jgi:glutathione S-transferase
VNLTMLTFGPMIDSELSRFLLWNYRIPYRERRHIFGWASVLTFLHRGYGQIPVIYGDGLSLTGPRALVDHFEPLCPADRILIPPEEPLRTNVEADWDTFNGELATYTSRVAYFNLLPHPDILIEPFIRGIPAREARLTPTLYPALRRLFGLLLRLKPEVVADSLEQAERIVDAVDARVADGRRYLWGDRLTLSDVTLATALGPFLLPPGYTAPIPDLPQMPPEMHKIITSYRQRPSGELVKRIYQARAADSAGGITP